MRELKNNSIINKESVQVLAKYKKRNSQFCFSDEEINNINIKKLNLIIESEFTLGKIRYGELSLRGNGKKHYIIICYISGPYKVNENLSGLTGILEIYRYLKVKDQKQNFSLLVIPHEMALDLWLSKKSLDPDSTILIDLKYLSDSELMIKQKNKYNDYYDSHLIKRNLINNYINNYFIACGKSFYSQKRKLSFSNDCASNFTNTSYINNSIKQIISFIKKLD